MVAPPGLLLTSITLRTLTVDDLSAFLTSIALSRVHTDTSLAFPIKCLARPRTVFFSGVRCSLIKTGSFGNNVAKPDTLKHFFLAATNQMDLVDRATNCVTILGCSFASLRFLRWCAIEMLARENPIPHTLTTTCRMKYTSTLSDR